MEEDSRVRMELRTFLQLPFNSLLFYGEKRTINRLASTLFYVMSVKRHVFESNMCEQLNLCCAQMSVFPLIYEMSTCFPHKRGQTVERLKRFVAMFRPDRNRYKIGNSSQDLKQFKAILSFHPNTRQTNS